MGRMCLLQKVLLDCTHRTKVQNDIIDFDGIGLAPVVIVRVHVILKSAPEDIPKTRNQETPLLNACANHLRNSSLFFYRIRSVE